MQSASAVSSLIICSGRTFIGTDSLAQRYHVYWPNTDIKEVLSAVSMASFGILHLVHWKMLIDVSVVRCASVIRVGRS